MEAKLADYRLKREKEKLMKERKDKLWKIITFEGFRQRIFSKPVKRDTSSEDLEPIEDVSNTEPWTLVDWLIFALKVLIWICCQILSAKFEFGAVFFSTSVFAVIYLYGFGRRDPKTMSAYSVFNENCQTLQGTLTAEQFEKEIRHQL